MTDLHFRSAKQLAADIRRGKVGCLEALDAFLRRMDRFELARLLEREFQGSVPPPDYR
jgi:Asp-tRNA(Asn)/Glu-tRNA(Gln) amidotransferase A subunit family amidase